MSTSMRRTVGDGSTWPPEALLADLGGDEVAIYDEDNHDAHVRSDWSVTLEDER